MSKDEAFWYFLAGLAFDLIGKRSNLMHRMFFRYSYYYKNLTLMKKGPF